MEQTEKMGRFEEIKKDYNCYGNMPLSNTDWLISEYEDAMKEIERLRKEKEWLIESYAYTRNLLGKEIETSNERFKQEIVKEMQQALKYSEALLRNSLRNGGGDKG